MASRPRSGTGYIGLEQWLGQNQQQAGAMANAMADGIDAQARKSEAHLSDAYEQFKYGADSSALNYVDDGLYDDKGKYSRESIPLTFKRDAEAKAFMEPGWKGPRTLDEISSYGSGRTLATGAQRDADLASDFYGRQALLQQQAGKGGGYSLGQQRLDSALVGAAGGDRIDATKAQWGGLLGKFDAKAAGAKSYAAEVEQKNKDTAARYADDVKKAQEYAKGAIKTDRDEAQKGLDAEREREKAERLRQREEEREARKRENGSADRGGGGKANVDRWVSSSIGW